METTTYTDPLAPEWTTWPDEEQEPCDYCGYPCNEDFPGETCSGHDGPIHATNQAGDHCHLLSECKRSE